MKCPAAHVLALASVAAAYPYPQELPSTTEPGSGFPGLGGGLGGGFARPTGFPSLGGGSGFPGLGGGSGLGGGLSLPTSLPSLGGGSSFPGLGGGSSLPGLGGIGSSSKTAASGTSIGTGGSSWMDWLSGLTGGLGGGTSAGSGEAAPPASPDTETPSAPATTAAPGGNSTGGSGGTGGNCKPQQASSGLLGGSENGIVDKNCCTDMTVVFARGTGEMGNVGTVSGPPMFKAIRSKLGADRVTVQGVDYPASAAGNVNLGGDGGEKMAALVKQVKSLCPNTKVIVSGYSQGAMVVHNAFNKGLSAEDVSGAVLFGDPLKRTAVGKLPTDKVKQFCGTADQICGGGGDGGATGSHISYGSSAEAAATFAIQAAGLA
ncbi:cutinase-domain-containing protein [Bipolaris maydis]|nr:cutinase-domain-containing protein [Bipolaris maydis]KAJ6197063.1 cutinase-domain-containing protein [Bipolaris maydis]KAJ6207959.1 cutinase-domain-containing protein [Bipolaris maydis]